MPKAYQEKEHQEGTGDNSSHDDRGLAGIFKREKNRAERESGDHEVRPSWSHARIIAPASPLVYRALEDPLASHVDADGNVTVDRTFERVRGC